ncbi:DUF6689 family protein [Microbulbifer litoralis]|uniref:DUF6689 family protein n=1 Tax=Microbulbifer litoralis TaxID=2933965 RepID=UPI0020278ECD|nr:DUF6689 family protein [Microbulbifer sp. GX H0434]
MRWYRKTDRKGSRKTSRVSLRARILGGLLLVLLATGASAGLLDLLRNTKVDINTGLLDLRLENLVLDLGLLLGLIELEIDGNQVLAILSLPGDIETDLLISFDRVLGLTEQNIGLSAREFDPVDPDLLQRLPPGAHVVPQADFPMMVQIEPVGGLAFSDTVELELHTHNLEYQPGTNLRLFAASGGEDFRDITTYVGSGSYRCRGRRGKFSEFLVVEDTRDTDVVIAGKFDFLQDKLHEFRGQMPSWIYWSLYLKVAHAKGAWAFDNDAGAVWKLKSAIATVEGYGGYWIPNTWRSSRDIDNVAGELSAAAQTLIFSLELPD